ncbi:hypothetical protein ABZ478_19365 [Streptomyces sp. NPDC005706]|uniref:hypothetical protein n=1 Tax=Streptomyces sp. NPDC005706 TaxID=3157169 RepID=UPI0033F9DC15
MSVWRWLVTVTVTAGVFFAAGEMLYRKRLDVEHYLDATASASALVIRGSLEVDAYATSVWPCVPGSIMEEERAARREVTLTCLTTSRMPEDVRRWGKAAVAAIDAADLKAYADAMGHYQFAMISHLQRPGVFRVLRAVMRPVRRPRRRSTRLRSSHAG